MPAAVSSSSLNLSFGSEMVGDKQGAFARSHLSVSENR
jgi:hypothetical protein